MDSVYEEVKKEFIKRGTYFVKDNELSVIRELLFPNGRINPEIAGKSVAYISEKAGLNVPDGCRLIVAEIASIGPSEVLSYEKLFPVLAMYKASSFEQAISLAERSIELAGKGHTSCLYTNPQNINNIEHYQNTINTVRMLINSPGKLKLKISIFINFYYYYLSFSS
jgi:acetaldehyde dehydrogenase/alcohol dehydrogenase